MPPAAAAAVKTIRVRRRNTQRIAPRSCDDQQTADPSGLTDLRMIRSVKPHAGATCYAIAPVGSERLTMIRSEEHTSELQSLMRISYAVFCLKKKKYTQPNDTNTTKIHNKIHLHHTC